MYVLVPCFSLSERALVSAHASVGSLCAVSRPSSVHVLLCARARAHGTLLAHPTVVGPLASLALLVLPTGV